MGLAYPGGRLLDMLARQGRADARLFPRPYLDNDNLDFSFSGLKTAAATWLGSLSGKESWPRPLHRPEDAPQALKDGCASFNMAVTETLMEKTRRALDRNPDLRRLIVAGGVAANSMLREQAAALMQSRGGRSHLSPAAPLYGQRGHGGLCRLAAGQRRLGASAFSRNHPARARHPRRHAPRDRTLTGRVKATTFGKPPARAVSSAWTPSRTKGVFHGDANFRCYV